MHVINGFMQEHISKILKGDLEVEVLFKTPSNKVLIFLSSTFTDTMAERNQLMKGGHTLFLTFSFSMYTQIFIHDIQRTYSDIVNLLEKRWCVKIYIDFAQGKEYYPHRHRTADENCSLKMSDATFCYNMIVKCL